MVLIATPLIHQTWRHEWRGVDQLSEPVLGESKCSCARGMQPIRASEAHTRRLRGEARIECRSSRNLKSDL